tara:strand:- start:147 stop:431 length:285 start_codon:yes stop_codon:yes gene_type:complete
MKNYFSQKLFKPIPLFIFLTSLISLKSDFIKAEYFSEELQMDTSTKTDENSSVIPTNPFELMEMIRKYNSMNEATNPSDAVDAALKSFNSLEGN